MALKILNKEKFQYKKQHAFTYVEMILAVTILAIVFGGFIVIIRPAEYKARARDNKRISDLSALDRMVNEFYLDNEYYPDLGLDDLSSYGVKIPEDPINDATYFYSYSTDGSSYEINARLEFLTEEMENDNGNQQDLYEIGNNLILLP